jgi:hypothetical protein
VIAAGATNAQLDAEALAIVTAQRYSMVSIPSFSFVVLP